MSQTPIPTDQTHSRRWHEVLAVYRRVCVLRRQNRRSEAEALHTAFDPAVAALREESDFDPSAFEAALVNEERRVEDAALVAEFVAPLLSAAASSPAPVSTAARPPARARPAPNNVAAFIDDMLAQPAPSTRR